MTDALANLATTLALSEGETTNIPVSNRWVLPSLDTSYHENSNTITIATNDEEDWKTPLIKYLKHSKLPDDTRYKTKVRQRSSYFIMYKDILYQRSFEGTYQRCLSGEEVLEAMTETHLGVFGTHRSGPKLHFRIKRMGYYWPTMVKDCLEYAKKCESCQLHANFIHQPPEPRHPTIASWPFDAWDLMSWAHHS
ncbi:UNVERIFIED_CONTAM: hypothetical protein Sradi_0876100 [Sesamum radiatum]|uniref:Integrase zinc-binding domain-containing protein n=1 Tax=Sesamum radiatum TaxID=300843 RepID=A0AAW2V2K2_SESRA